VRGGTSGLRGDGEDPLANAPDIRTTMRPACRVSMRRCGRACGPRRARPRKTIARLNAAVADALADPAVAQPAARHRPGAVRARAAPAPTRWRHSRRPKPDKWWPIIRAANLEGRMSRVVLRLRLLRKRPSAVPASGVNDGSTTPRRMCMMRRPPPLSIFDSKVPPLRAAWDSRGGSGRVVVGRL